jgi:hypothetical protein
VRYIHLNPLRAGLFGELRELGSYAYSGHCVLMGKRKREWQGTWDQPIGRDEIDRARTGNIRAGSDPGRSARISVNQEPETPLAG